MAKSRLHELSEQGVSVWIDSLSREMLETGELARLMKDDAVVGVTSNPTIFQKAMSEGDWYDAQLGEVMKTEDDPTEIFLALAKQDIKDACDLLRPVWDEGKGLDGWVSLEVDPTLAYDREATFEQAIRFHEEIDRPNLFVKIPATVPGLGAIEDAIAKGKSINVTLIFSLDRYAAVAEAYIRGLERLVAAGGDPDARRLRRELLRLARRHRGRPAARGDRRPGHPPAGEARDRERQARVPPLAGDVRRPALGVPGRKGRDPAALPLGLHLDEEPGVPRRDVRRGADRAADGEHDAGRDDRGLPGSRQGRRRTRSLRESTRRRSCSSASPRSASTTTTSSRRWRREGVQKFADSFEELLDGIRAKRSELAAA